MIDVKVLRAAGLTNDQIAIVNEIAAPIIAERNELRERLSGIREQNRKRKQNQRSRHVTQVSEKPNRINGHVTCHVTSEKPNGINGHVPVTPRESSSFFFLESERKKESPHLKTDFEAFYAVYPRKVGKVEAEKAYAKARRRATHAEIMVGLQRQMPDLAATDPQYRPHPTTWLNAGRWLDEITVSRRRSSII